VYDVTLCIPHIVPYHNLSAAIVRIQGLSKRTKIRACQRGLLVATTAQLEGQMVRVGGLDTIPTLAILTQASSLAF
jgi:hypothetical protein